MPASLGRSAASGSSLLLLAPRRELRLVGLAAWALGAAGLASYLAPDGRTRLLLAAAAVGGVIAAAGAVLLLRWPWVLALATLACVPIRIPVELGGEEANLLLPLYARRRPARARPRAGNSCAATTAFARARTRGAPARGFRRLDGPVAPLERRSPAGRDLPARVRASLRVARDRLRPAPVEPDGALRGLYGALRRDGARRTRGSALFQWVTRDVFWNPKVIVGNAYAPFFRVNSVFYDPSIYGRYLVVAILAALGFVLLGLRGRLVAGAFVAVAALWVGLLFSFSQSSFAALVAGVLVAATVVWRWRAAAAAGFVAAVLLSVGFATPQVRTTLLKESRAGLEQRDERPSEPRHERHSDRRRPSARGSRRRQLQARLRRSNRAEGARAAEGGLPLDARDRRGRDRASPASCSWSGSAWPRWVRRCSALTGHDAGRAALAVGLTLGAIAVHSLFYNALFEDPMTWALLGLVALDGRPPAGRGRRRVIEGWKRVLVLAPHTDDGEFGCGGTMARLVEAGVEVHYVAFSIATRSLPRRLRARHARARGARGDRRARDPRGAAPRSTTSTCARFPSGGRTSSSCSSALWEELRPDAVFQPSHHDVHQDHQTIAQEGLRAFKRTTVLGYEIPWNNFDFSYGAYLALEQRHVERKVAALVALRLAAASPLRERRVHLEPRARPRDQREPRVRRGVPGLPDRGLTTRGRAPAVGSAPRSGYLSPCLGRQTLAANVTSSYHPG